MTGFRRFPGLMAFTLGGSLLFFLATGAGTAQDAEARPSGGRGVEVRGVVMDHLTGEPLGGAAVSLGPGLAGIPGRGTRVTSDEGRFRFDDVTPGTYRLSVTLLGYQAMADTVQVPAANGLDLVLLLSTQPIPLAPIVVEVGREGRPGPGYQGRDRAGAGPYLLTRADIARRHPLRVTDVLASVPGARVVRRPYLGSVLLLRGDCVPALVMDGVRLPNVEGIDRLVSPADVESLRVYHGAELPVEYGLHQCGGVVIETRHGPGVEERDEPGLPSGWRRRLTVVTLLVFAVLLTR